MDESTSANSELLARRRFLSSVIGCSAALAAKTLNPPSMSDVRNRVRSHFNGTTSTVKMDFFFLRTMFLVLILVIFVIGSS